MMNLQPLVNKTAEFAYRGARLGFDLSHALFSSFDVDAGTRLLLKEIAHDEVITGAASILDAGCGVGVLGISMAASCPRARVVMRDRDILACAFSERNCWRNGIPATRLDPGGEAAPSIARRAPKHKNKEARQAETVIAPGLLGEDDSLGPYGAVLSNLPAKAGPAVLSRFVGTDAGLLLSPGGRFAFVIVNTLAELADRWCAASGMTLAKKTAAKSHTVYILEKPAVPEMPMLPVAEAAISRPDERLGFAGIYRRSESPRRLGRYSVRASGFWGLPEFDTTSFATELAIEALEKACAGSLVRDFLVSEPGIGLSALWVCKALGPSRIHALSRDLLSLLAAKSNIEAAFNPSPEILSIPSIDADAVADASIDAILWFPDEVPEYDAVSPAWEFLRRTAKKGAAIVVVSNPTSTARFEKAKPTGIQRLGEKKRKGYAALMYRRLG